MSKSTPKKDPELYPDAWARFERAVDVVAKSPPQHRARPSKAKRARKKAVDTVLSINCEPMLSALSDISELITKTGPERCKRFVNFFEFGAGFVVEPDLVSAISTGKIRMVAKPSNSFLGLMTAIASDRHF